MIDQLALMRHEQRLQDLRDEAAQERPAQASVRPMRVMPSPVSLLSAFSARLLATWFAIRAAVALAR